MDTKRVLIITTGGTIAGQVAIGERDEGLPYSSEGLLEVLQPTIAYLKRKGNTSIEVGTNALCELDSSEIHPAHWIKLVSLIKSHYDDYDSFIITHGTNTLGYTSAALAFAIANPDKPVILTGSQIPAGLPSSDAMSNLNNALRLAVLNRNRNPIIGVVVVFGTQIITGTRATKFSEFDYDSFISFKSESLGRIGRIFDINERSLENHLSYLSTNLYPEAKRAKDLIIESDFDMRIASLTEFPGMSPDVFKSLVELSEIRGFILRAFGGGDPSSSFRPAFEYLKSREIPIIVSTQVSNGTSNLRINEPGMYLLENKLAIPSYDMSIESQTTKLAWLLAKKNSGQLTYDQICSEMVRDYRGEINVIHNLDY